MAKDIIFQIVKKQLDSYDAYCLLASGAPQDEFDIESEIIAQQLKKGMSVGTIAKIMAQVMTAQFAETFAAEGFVPYAEQIEKNLRNI